MSDFIMNITIPFSFGIVFFCVNSFPSMLFALLAGVLIKRRRSVSELKNPRLFLRCLLPNIVFGLWALIASFIPASATVSPINELMFVSLSALHGLWIGYTFVTDSLRADRWDVGMRFFAFCYCIPFVLSFIGLVASLGVELNNPNSKWEFPHPD